MIYDQALTIVLEKGGSEERITTNFKYTVKDMLSESSWKYLKTSDYDSFDSVCTETMVGFWQNKTDNKLSCVTGRQIHKDNDIVLDAEKSTE